MITRLGFVQFDDYSVPRKLRRTPSTYVYVVHQANQQVIDVSSSPYTLWFSVNITTDLTLDRLKLGVATSPFAQRGKDPTAPTLHVRPQTVVCSIFSWIDTEYDEQRFHLRVQLWQMCGRDSSIMKILGPRSCPAK